MGQHDLDGGGFPAAPDDTESDEMIARAVDLTEALFEIAEKYQAPLTNNLPRWQDGVYLRHIGDFIQDVKDQVARFADQVPAATITASTTDAVADTAAAQAVKDAAAIRSLAWECAYWELTAVERRRFWTYGRDWRGWAQIGSDEYRRRTLVLGVPFVGALVVALWRCRCEDCAADIAALRATVESED